MSIHNEAVFSIQNHRSIQNSMLRENLVKRDCFFVARVIAFACRFFQWFSIFCQKIFNSSKTITNQQPRIVNDGWGKISVFSNGRKQEFKDVVILPRSAMEWKWDWQTPSMSHCPGIRIVDLDHYILASPIMPDVVILSCGRGHGGRRDNSGPGILEVDSSLISYLQSKGVSEVFILKTAAAIDQYQKLCAFGNKKIAALIHTTC